MKRLVAIVTGFVLLWYAGAIIYPVLPKGMKAGNIKVVFEKIRISVGLGSLFDRPVSLTKRFVSYRFYENGKWQEKRDLLQPLFDDYLTKGYFASLTHARLDASLVFNLYRIHRVNGMETVRKSNDYSMFVNHMFSYHVGTKKPDSLEIFYTKKNNDNSVELLLNFKCIP